MKWLHISDIHYDNINDGTLTIMLRNDFEKIAKKHNILVDEVFFTGDFRHARNQKGQDIDIVAKEAVCFLRHIASLVGVTEDSHIHIVPGNHDLDCGDMDSLDSEEAKKLTQAIKSYNGNFFGSSKNELRRRFGFFEKCAELLNNIVWRDFCEGYIHRYKIYNEYSIVYLNTAIVSGQKGERGNLVIGTADLFNILSEVKKKNDGKPIIFLAHHPMEVFSTNEITIIKDIINDVNLPALWLCGDFHDMLENNTYEIAQITTGCFKKEPNVEAGFYIGEYLAPKGVRFEAYLGSKRGKWDYSESYSEYANKALPQALRWNDGVYPNEYLTAEHYAEQGEYENAIWLCIRALEEQNIENAVMVKMNLSLGYWYCWVDENQKAIDTLMPLIDSFKKQKDDRNLALCYNYIGLAYEEMKRWSVAEYNYLQAKNIYEGLNIESYTSLALKFEANQCYANIGLMYFRWGQSSPSEDYFGNAKLYYEKALLFFEKNESEFLSKTAIFYNNYALFCDNQKEYLRAIYYYKKALAIKSKTIGQWHRSTARIYANIGLAYANLDDSYNALKNCETAKRIYGDYNESQSRDALRNFGIIAALKIKTKEYDEALNLLTELLSMRIKKFGHNDTDVAQTLHNLGKVYFEKGDMPKALKHFEEAFAIRDAKIPTQRYTVETILCIAESYNRLSDYRRALTWYEKASNIQINSFGNNHDDIQKTLSQIKNMQDKLSCFKSHNGGKSMSGNQPLG